MDLERIRAFCLKLAGTFKCTPEEFAELTERGGVVPAAYVARCHWVSLERWDALSDAEIERLVRNSYEMVRAKLPKRVRGRLAAKKQRRGAPR